MTFAPQYLTTALGSVPYAEPESITAAILETLDIPAWPQLSKRTFKENMYVQYSHNLPGIVLDETNEKITFDTARDLSAEMEAFYERIIADDVDSFALTPEYATGFFTMLDAMQTQPREFVKGHVTGPISFGLTVTDQALRASLYDDLLADAIVKQLAMNARWQVRQLKAVSTQVIIFVDEPYMASFGSTFISLSREQAITLIDEVVTAIHAEGALAGIHCCANTDWSVLMATGVDILNLDAYGYLDNLALYPSELRAFLDRGGSVAWGIVPNNQTIYDETSSSIAAKLRAGIVNICEKAKKRGVTIHPEEFQTRSLIAPSCGLGSTTPEIAQQTLTLTQAVAQLLLA